MKQSTDLVAVSNLAIVSHRSSRLEAVFCEESVLKNFAKFTGKNLCQSFLLKKSFIKNFLKKFIRGETMEQVLSCEFCKIFKSTFFYSTTPLSVSILTQITPNSCCDIWSLHGNSLKQATKTSRKGETASRTFHISNKCNIEKVTSFELLCSGETKQSISHYLTKTTELHL